MVRKLKMYIEWEDSEGSYVLSRVVEDPVFVPAPNDLIIAGPDDTPLPVHSRVLQLNGDAYARCILDGQQLTSYTASLLAMAGWKREQTIDD